MLFKIDAAALRDIVSGEHRRFSGVRGSARLRCLAVHVKGKRVAAALHLDNRLERHRRNICRACEECSGDHSTTQIGRATPWMAVTGTPPKYRLSKLRGSCTDSSQTSPARTL